LGDAECTFGGRTPFVLVNVWRHLEPTYEESTLATARAVFATAGATPLPVVMMGDFNLTPLLPKQRKTTPEVFRRLREEFGLASAYHTHLSVEHGAEPHPTHYWRWQQESPWHIDYCLSRKVGPQRSKASRWGRLKSGGIAITGH
jgi:endonuclease/exonuclease/phosphatase family metal-dependent hydrolase